MVPLNRSSGTRQTFTLTDPLKIRKGEFLALTAPDLVAVVRRRPERRDSNVWRSSRAEGACSENTPGHQERQAAAEGRLHRAYGCDYGAPASSTGATTYPAERLEPAQRVSGQGGLAQPAVRAVADVEADQLVAAAAGAQVLGRAQQRRVRRRERQGPGHRLHLLAGLAVDVDAAGLGRGEGLAAGGAGAQAVDLASGSASRAKRYPVGRLRDDIGCARDEGPRLPRLAAPRDRLERLQRQPGTALARSATRCTWSARTARSRRPRRRRRPGSVTIHNPDIGGLLPVFVHDTYEGFEVKTFARAHRRRARRATSMRNVAAVRELVDRARRGRRGARQPPGDGPGDPRPRRAATTRSRSTARTSPTRSCPTSSASALRPRGAPRAPPASWSAPATSPSACAAPSTSPRSTPRSGSARPGVDTELFSPTPAGGAPPSGARARSHRRLRRRGHDPAGPAATSWDRDPRPPPTRSTGTPEARGPRVIFVGKLIVSKGVDLLLAAWPLVHRADTRAPAC